MDKRRSVLNVSVSVVTKLITMVLIIVVKRFLIRICGNEINGLNALYISLVGLLSVAELGVGSAITFCMYKPIVEGDLPSVSALYRLFRRLYRIIGAVILGLGLAAMPFLRYLAADYGLPEREMYAGFVLVLVSVVITYFFGAKTALINAHKNDYITTAVSSGATVVQYTLQIAVLLVTRSFIWYLVCRIVAALLQWAVTELFARRMFGAVLSGHHSLDPVSRGELTRSIKAMFLHKIGYLLVNTVDSVIISYFMGVAVLGVYSNYAAVLAAMTGVLKLLFSSLNSVLGHLHARQGKEKAREYCDALHLVNFMVGVVFFLGYYGVIDDLVAVLFAGDLVAARPVSAVIAVNGFVQFMRANVLTFREATGTFYYDRWKPLVEGVVNVVLSLLLASRFGVAGVIGATVLTNLVICHVVEPYVLYCHGFAASPRSYYLRNYGMILVFIAVLPVLELCMQQRDNRWIGLLVNGCISVAFSAVICMAVLLGSPALRRLLFGGRKGR